MRERARLDEIEETGKSIIAAYRGLIERAPFTADVAWETFDWLVREEGKMYYVSESIEYATDLYSQYQKLGI